MITLKSGTRLKLLFALLLSTSVFLNSCSVDRKPNFKVGVSQCANDEWRQKMNAEMRREAMLSHVISLDIKNADGDSRRQIEDVKYFIEEKYDLIIVSPNEAEALTPIVANAYDAGIPVVVVDRNVIGDKYTAFIGADNVEVGQLQGQYIKTALPKGGKIIEIRGLSGSSPAMERHQGLMEIIEDTDIEICASVDAEWHEDQAIHLMDSLLRIYPDVDLVAAQNDRMARGAFKAANALLPENDIIMLGVDAIPGENYGLQDVLDGELQATVLYPTGGEEVISLALKILLDVPYEKMTVLKTNLVEKENAELMNRFAELIHDKEVKVEALNQEVDAYMKIGANQRHLIIAFIVFLLIVLVISVLIYHGYKQRSKQNELLINMAREVEEATHAKLMFFTNVSHDFRTPLTLIADPVERLSKDESLDDSQRELLKIADKNVRILLRLINQILDFRKYESGKATLVMTGLKLDVCLETWLDAFSLLAERKQIKLELDIDRRVDYVTMLDGEKTERIFFNLMSNAFKFTPKGGFVKVSLSGLRMGDSLWHRIAVTNSGEVISTEYIHNIFDHFYQIDTSRFEGSGIGLALVKSFVDMMGGRIDVESDAARGTTFTVLLPVGEVKDGITDTVNLISKEMILAELGDVEVHYDDNDDNDDGRNTLLVIDDNPDIRILIKALFKDKFRIIEASNGEDGFKAAIKSVPNLIICDVMMPVMDGMECCRRIKRETATSHIPVLLLTACSLDEQKASGLECGADAYLSKPFNARVLVAQVNSLLKNRGRILGLFGSVDSPDSEEDNPGGDDIIVSSNMLNDADIQFINKLKKYIDDNIDDSALSVEKLGESLGLSRTQLYRKVKTLTNYTPVELIKITRLTKAREMLSDTELSIAEITYLTGFSSPSYFTKCYKEYYGEIPTVIRQNRSAKNVAQQN